MEKNGTTNKKYLGKRDYRLGVICGGLSTIPFLLCFLAAFDSRYHPRSDWIDRFGHQIEGFFDGLGLFAFVWVFVPLVIVLAISALYVKRRMPEWKDKDDQIAPVVMAFFGCALRLLLIGTVWPISIWFIGRNSGQKPKPHRIYVPTAKRCYIAYNLGYYWTQNRIGCIVALMIFAVCVLILINFVTQSNNEIRDRQRYTWQS